MALFTTTSAKRRQAFMERWRFPHFDGTSMQMGQDWIDRERTASQPDHDMWLQYVLRLGPIHQHLTEDRLYDLLENARPCLPPSASNTPDSLITLVKAALIRSQQDHCIYLGFDKETIPRYLLVTKIGSIKMVLPIQEIREGAIEITCRLEQDQWRRHIAMSALLNSWQRRTENWENIRADLMDLLQTCLDEMETRNGQTFDNAVAVSDDGCSIITADWVVIVDDQGHLTHHDPDRFHRNKILREGKPVRHVASIADIGGFPPERNAFGRSMALAALKNREWHEQILIKVQHALPGDPSDKHILLTPTRFAPSLDD